MWCRPLGLRQRKGSWPTRVEAEPVLERQRDLVADHDR